MIRIMTIITVGVSVAMTVAVHALAFTGHPGYALTAFIVGAVVITNWKIVTGKEDGDR